MTKPKRLPHKEEGKKGDTVSGLLNLIMLGGAGLGIASFIMVLGLRGDVKELQSQIEDMKIEQSGAK